MDIFVVLIAGLSGAAFALAISPFIRKLVRRRRALERIASDRQIIASTKSEQEEVDNRVERAQEPEFTSRIINSTVPRNYRQLAIEKSKFEIELLKKYENVVGIALGNAHVGTEERKTPAIVVMYDQKSDQNQRDVEDFIKDSLSTQDSTFAGTVVPIESIITGRIVQTTGIVPVGTRLTDKVRPVVGGVSISHVDAEPGTLATCCYPQSPLPNMPPIFYMLSNSHVLAGENSERGEWIIQPGSHSESNNEEDYIGWLERYTKIKYLADDPMSFNDVDAAIAAGDFSELNRAIYWTGVLDGCDYVPDIGAEVHKTGSISGFTRSRVTAIDATIKVDLDGKTARFRHQIVVEKMTDSGDSGSLLVDSSSRRAVGLVFAHSSEKQHTYANNILLVEYFLGIRIAEDGTTPPDVDPIFVINDRRDRVRPS